MSDAVRIPLRVTPRGGRDAIEGVGPDGELQVRVAAPPADGAANAAVVKLLAKALCVPPTAVTIEAGATSRHKRVHVDGLTTSAVRERWPDVGVRAR